MCGIVGFSGKSNAANILVEGLEKLEYRGYDSAGIALMQNKNISVNKTVNRISALKDEILPQMYENTSLGLGHTRWATHGAPTLENAHPHLSRDGKFAVVHNGIIENYSALKEELLAEGFEFLSETDTEVVPLLLEKYYNGNIKSTVNSVINRLEGSFALGIICTDCPETLIAVKKFSPLIIGIGDNCNLIASDVTALVTHTKNVIYLNDGEVAFLTPNSVEIFDSTGAMTSNKISVINWDISAAEKGGYNHFMMKEIMEQPEAIKRTLDTYLKNGEIGFPKLNLSADALKKFKRISIIACGSAYHVGMVGKYLFEELLRIPTEVDLASEFRYRNPVIDADTLAIAISQSGETADTLAAINTAKQNGAYTLSIVNVVGSSIAKATNGVIYIHAGPEIAVATTKGYSTQLVILYLLASLMAEKRGRGTSEEINELLASLKDIPQKISEILNNQSSIKSIADELGKPCSVFFIGRNTDYAVSLEASLKLKEISYINSQSYAAGELKHGTISLIEEGVPVIALCANENLKSKMLSNIKEVRARGAHVFACVNEGDNSFEGEEIKTFSIPETHTLLTPLLEVIPFQLLAYFVAENLGCDIDKPRNLAKSVTVE